MHLHFNPSPVLQMVDSSDNSRSEPERNPYSALSEPQSAPDAPLSEAEFRRYARTTESVWIRLSLIVGAVVLAAVAIFMLPKIGGRSSRLQTQSDARSDIWRRQLLESGRAVPDPRPPGARPGEVLLIVGLVAGGGAAVAGLAYVALRSPKA